MNEEYPILVAQDGPLKGQRWALSHTLMVGRDPTCEIIVHDRQVSRFHARITPTHEGVTIEDLGSKNGTNHNGTELTAPVMLQDGDLLGIALAQQFLFLTSDATMPLIEGGLRPGRLLMDQKSRQVWVNQQQVTPPLSAQQFKLLWMLYESQGQVISRAILYPLYGAKIRWLVCLIRLWMHSSAVCVTVLLHLIQLINTLTRSAVMAYGWIIPHLGMSKYGCSIRKTSCPYYSQHAHCRTWHNAR